MESRLAVEKYVVAAQQFQFGHGGEPWSHGDEVFHVGFGIDVSIRPRR